jgi:hypothetical protein
MMLTLGDVSPTVGEAVTRAAMVAKMMVVNFMVPK